MPVLGRSAPEILIVGGLGFIFSYVTEHFVSLGWDVHVVDNLSAGSHPELLENRQFTFYELDACDEAMTDLIYTLEPDYIIHAAAISDVDASLKSPFDVVMNNIGATLRVFEGARQLKNLKKLLYVSTDEVYGECEERKAEDGIIFPRNPYAASKAMGSMIRYAWDHSFESLHDKTVETRFCNIFGPRQDARKIIPAIKRAIDTGEPVTLHNDGEGYREFLYVKEIPPVIEMLLKSGHRTYNVTANQGYTVIDLLDRALHLTGKEVPTSAATRNGMDMLYQMDATRLKREFDWRPQYNFAYAYGQYLAGTPL